MNLIVFDLGGVCIFNFQTIGKIALHYHLNEDDVYAEYMRSDIPLMEGSMTTKEWWKAASEKFGVEADADPLVDLFTPVPNPPVLEIADELRKRGKRVVCGSNTCEGHWQKMNACASLESHFDRCYLSQRMGLAKPDVRCFDYILRSEGVNARDALFIDDTRANIEGAEKAGMRGFLFRDEFSWSAVDKLRSIVL